MFCFCCIFNYNCCDETKKSNVVSFVFIVVFNFQKKPQKKGNKAFIYFIFIQRRALAGISIVEELWWIIMISHEIQVIYRNQKV